MYLNIQCNDLCSLTSWFDLKANSAYQKGLAERYKIERKFGKAKGQHGLEDAAIMDWTATPLRRC